MLRPGLAERAITDPEFGAVAAAMTPSSWCAPASRGEDGDPATPVEVAAGRPPDTQPLRAESVAGLDARLPRRRGVHWPRRTRRQTPHGCGAGSPGGEDNPPSVAAERRTAIGSLLLVTSDVISARTIRPTGVSKRSEMSIHYGQRGYSNHRRPQDECALDQRS